MELNKVDDKTAYENLLIKYAELENKIADIKANCDLAIEGRDIKIVELEQENEELKKQGDKWFVFETEAGNWGMDKATQYTVDRHNYFYGTKEECQKWGVEHKIKDYTGHKYCYDRLEEQLVKAKEIIRTFLNMPMPNNEEVFADVGMFLTKAEQFLKEIEK